MKARELAQKLADNADRVAMELLPNGKREGNEWRCGSVDGQEGKSLGVHLTGTKAGVWADFSAGDGGDLLDLWQAVRGCGLVEAMEQAGKFLGISVVEHERKTYPKPKRPEGSKSANGPVLEWLTATRKISPEAVKAYRVAEHKGTHVMFPHFRNGDWLNYKLRSITDKKDMRTAAGCEQMLWGWQAIPENARSVTICEGELDAMSLWQYGHPALSVFSGAGNLAWLENDYPHLERFDDIYICFDNDDAGKKGALQLVDRLGRDRCLMVKLPKKDANDCLMAGVSKEAIDEAFKTASSMAPQNLRGAGDFVADVLHLFYPANGDSHGVMLPWPSMMRNVQFRPAEMSIWTGISGHGKSQLLGQVMLSAMEQGEKVCIASMEMKPGRTLQRMVRQALGTSQPAPEDVKRFLNFIDGKMWFFDFVGETKTDSLLEIFSYARKRFGVSQFVVDNLMMLDASEEDLDRQSQTVKKLMLFKSENDCHIHLVAHARKGNDEARAPRKMDVKGSGNIVNQADNVFSVWRNKAKEDGNGTPSDPDAMLYVDKQRNGEWEGALMLWYDRVSLSYRDHTQSSFRPMHFGKPERSRQAAGEMVEF